MGHRWVPQGVILTILGCESRSRTPISVLTIFLSIWKAEPAWRWHHLCCAPPLRDPSPAAPPAQIWHFAAPGTPGSMPVPQPRARHGAPAVLRCFGSGAEPPTHTLQPSPTLTVFFRILAAYGAPVPFSWQLYTTEVAPLGAERREVAWRWPGWRGVPLTPCPHRDPYQHQTPGARCACLPHHSG